MSSLKSLPWEVTYQISGRMNAKDLASWSCTNKLSYHGLKLDLYQTAVKENHGNDALDKAIRLGKNYAVNLLLDFGANPNGRSLKRMGSSSNCLYHLQHAAKRGDLQIARRLIEHGATVMIDNVINSMQPICLAIKNWDVEMATFLFDGGARLEGEDPAAIIVESYRPGCGIDPAPMIRLLSQEISFSTYNRHGYLLLFRSAILDMECANMHYLTSKKRWSRLLPKHMVLTQCLIDHGADLDAVNDSGSDILMQIEFDNVRSSQIKDAWAKFFLNNGASPPKHKTDVEQYGKDEEDESNDEAGDEVDDEADDETEDEEGEEGEEY